ncbi:YitT family protein [Acetonema longum]|uniref:DUF2179 domain-containing protein n=1 Tax=Acetonema longum DSM 6540 TaxID=1009370 RepID=F7NNY0_9FIRM|nr:YitT family protein [Acetonema longum]EGO62314.1 hypothetical protein ALO_19107 [Acetonema longum DSM 6540]
MSTWLKNYAGITLGTVVTATALNMFLIPNKIAAGGTSGLATVFHHLWGWPVGVAMLGMDFPLFIGSVKVLGAGFGINTLFGSVVLSLSIDLLAPYTPVLTHDILLSTLYGGVLSGVGMGLVFRFRGTTAGTDMAAAVVNKLFGVSLGRALLGIDCFVIAIAGFAFGSAELSLYALISLFVTTQIIDLIQEGPNSAKAFLIMSDRTAEIAQAIMAELGRGVTFLFGRGGYSGKEREMLVCVVSKKEVQAMKDLISKTDDKAFVIVADAHEVLGEGFTRI